MNQLRWAITGLSVLCAVWLASCSVPVGTASDSTPKTSTLGAGQARLVFQVGAAKALSRALADAGYLTLEMRSVADGTVKADDATRELDGSYLVSIDGLVAGDWRLKVRLYADATAPDLMYYTDLTHYVAVGTPTSIALKVYEPSSLAGGTITLADKVEYLEVEGRGVVWGTSLNPSAPKTTQAFRPGETVQIHAIPMTVPSDEDFAPTFDSDTTRNPVFDEYWDPTFDYDSLDNPLGNDEDYWPDWDDNADQGLLARPATDRRVTYLSDDPEVVDITATGRLRARGLGETTIHITTVEGRKTASIPVKVEETVVGVWTYGAPLSRVLKVERSVSGDLWATLMTNLEDGAIGEAEVQRGRVTKQLDGSYKTSLNQVLDFPMVLATPDRTKRVFTSNSMGSSVTFSEQDGQTLAVVIGNAMSSANYTRLDGYVPVNRFEGFVNVGSDPYDLYDTNDGWSVDPGLWNLENDTAGEPETFSQLYWWVEDTNVAYADSKTGELTLVNPGATKIRVQSLDNPSLPALSWNLIVRGQAPSLSLVNFNVDIPSNYTNSGKPDQYQKLDLQIQVAFDPAQHPFIDLQEWDGLNWVHVVELGLAGLNQGDWFSTYVPTMFESGKRYRVITKASGYFDASPPSPELLVWSPDANGNPVLWPGSNTAPDGVTALFNDGDDYTVPIYDAGGEVYRSRWFTAADGSSWNPSLMYSLRWGTQTWWIYSDNVSGSVPGAYVVGRNHLGNQVGSAVFLAVPQVYNIGSMQSNGRVILFGSGSTSKTLAWNSSTKVFEEYNP